MKKNIFTVLMIVVIFFTGCKKNNEFKNIFRGKMDGVAFDYSETVHTIGTGNNALTITAEHGGLVIVLRMVQALGSPINPGEYIFDASKSLSATISSTLNGNIYFAGWTISGLQGSGKITILKISNEYVSGNFEFTTHPDIMTNTVITVTNGEFYIKRN